jgi:hypothetical protein
MKTVRTLLLVSVIAASAGSAALAEDLTDVEFYGYKVAHHMGAMIQHIEKFGFNTFDHPPMLDHRFFVITPARDDRYGSLLVTDMEHFGIYAEVTDPKGQRLVIVHEHFKGKLPEGTVIRTKSDFPLVAALVADFEEQVGTAREAAGDNLAEFADEVDVAAVELTGKIEAEIETRRTLISEQIALLVNEFQEQLLSLIDDLRPEPPSFGRP